MSAAAELSPATPAILGARWAGLLCAALLAGLGLHTVARWLGDGPSQETAVLQPTTRADFVRESPPDLSAPDPGDNP